MTVRSVALFSPAKINLFLAVTGRRADGFHDLVSLAAPLMFGDTIWLHQSKRPGPVSLICDEPAVPTGADNLAHRAAEIFRQATNNDRAVTIELRKRIPMGAGLGGGSSNAAAVLRGLNTLAGNQVDFGTLAQLAASLGSDCPLFLAGGPCVVRGRGEVVTKVSAEVRARIQGTRLLVFKPDFPINTQWAYEHLTHDAMVPIQKAEHELSRWLESAAIPSAVLFNSFEAVVTRKFLAIGELLDSIRVAPGVNGALLSGSGSASFAFLNANGNDAGPMEIIRGALGPDSLVANTTIA